jgi:hypothetical protein
MVTAPMKVWNDLIASNKKYSWYRLNQLLYIDALETCFDGRQATGEGARSIQSIRVQEDNDEDQDEEEDDDREIQTQLQLDTQVEPNSQALPTIEEDETQDIEIEKLIVRKRKQS